MRISLTQTVLLLMLCLTHFFSLADGHSGLGAGRSQPDLQVVDIWLDTTNANVIVITRENSLKVYFGKRDANRLYEVDYEDTGSNWKTGKLNFKLRSFFGDEANFTAKVMGPGKIELEDTYQSSTYVYSSLRLTSQRHKEAGLKKLAGRTETYIDSVESGLVELVPLSAKTLKDQRIFPLTGSNQIGWLLVKGGDFEEGDLNRSRFYIITPFQPSVEHPPLATITNLGEPVKTTRIGVDGRSARYLLSPSGSLVRFEITFQYTTNMIEVVETSDSHEARMSGQIDLSDSTGSQQDLRSQLRARLVPEPILSRSLPDPFSDLLHKTYHSQPDCNQLLIDGTIQ